MMFFNSEIQKNTLKIVSIFFGVYFKESRFSFMELTKEKNFILSKLYRLNHRTF